MNLSLVDFSLSEIPPPGIPAQFTMEFTFRDLMLLGHDEAHRQWRAAKDEILRRHYVVEEYVDRTRNITIARCTYGS